MTLPDFVQKFLPQFTIPDNIAVIYVAAMVFLGLCQDTTTCLISLVKIVTLKKIVEKTLSYDPENEMSFSLYTAIPTFLAWHTYSIYTFDDPTYFLFAKYFHIALLALIGYGDVSSHKHLSSQAISGYIIGSFFGY